MQKCNCAIIMLTWIISLWFESELQEKQTHSYTSQLQQR